MLSSPYSIYRKEMSFMKMRRGDIVFVQGKGTISKIVRYFDGGGKFSHVAIAISDRKVIESDVGTKVALREFKRDNYNVIEVVNLGLSIKQRRDVYNTALKFIGVHYDYMQLIWYALRKIFKLEGRNRLNNPRNFICSELVFNVLDEVGILDDLGIKETSFVGSDLTPNELYDLVKYVGKK